MQIASKFTKCFLSKDLTKRKYKDIEKMALEIREHKNHISKEMCTDLFSYTNMSYYVFSIEMVEKYKGLNISSNFYKQIYQDVYTCYENKFIAIKFKMKFFTNEFLGVEKYKRDTKNNKKGDVKRIVFKTEETKLTAALTFLARHGRENTEFFLKDRLLNDKEFTDKKL